MRGMIYGFGFGLFTVAGGVYISAPFQDGFDANHAPDSPPLASVVSSSTAVTATDGQVWDAIADNPIDVRPPYSVKLVRLK
jgi:hypothetical protein